MFAQQLIERQLGSSRLSRYRAHRRIDTCASRRCKLRNATSSASTASSSSSSSSATSATAKASSVPTRAAFHDEVARNRLKQLTISQCLDHISTLSPISCMALAPLNERYLLVGGWRRTVELFDLDPAPRSFQIPPSDDSDAEDDSSRSFNTRRARRGGRKRTLRADDELLNVSSASAAAARAKRRFETIVSSYSKWRAERRSGLVKAKRLWFSRGKATVDSSRRQRELGAADGSVEAPQKTAHQSAVSAVRWVPDDTALFASASMDGTLKMWDTTGLQLLSELELDDEAHIQDIDFGSQSHQHLIAVASSSKDLLLYDPRCNEVVTALQGCEGALHSTKWRPTHAFEVAAGCARGTICIFDIRHNIKMTSLDDDGAGGKATRTARERKGRSKKKTMAAKLKPLRYLDMYRACRGDLASTAPPRAHLGVVNGLTFTSDGAMLLSSGTDSRLRLWDVHGSEQPTNTLVHYFPTPNPVTGATGGVALAEPGGSWLAPSSHRTRQRCIVFHAGRIRGTLTGFDLLSGRNVFEPKPGAGVPAAAAGMGGNPGGYMGPLRTLLYRRSHHQILGAGRFPVVMAWDCSRIDNSVTDENQSRAHRGHPLRTGMPFNRRTDGHSDSDDSDELWFD